MLNHRLFYVFEDNPVQKAIIPKLKRTKTQKVIKNLRIPMLRMAMSHNKTITSLCSCESEDLLTLESNIPLSRIEYRFLSPVIGP